MNAAIQLDRTSQSHISEPARECVVYDDVDVLVVGGGPAGVAAAVSSARAGAKTLVIERYGCFGGIWTAGLLNPFFDAANKGGICFEIIDRLKSHGGKNSVTDWSRKTPSAHVFDFEAMKFILDRMIIEANVNMLLYTHAVAAVMDNNRVRGVIVENKSGRQAILARVVIDCTGDGDVAYHAGCDYEVGRPTDGLTQPMTLQFKVRGVRWGRRPYNVLLKYNNPDDLTRIPFASIAPIPLPGENDTAAVMWTHIRGMDGCDADDLTRAVVEGRLQVQHAMALLKSASDVLGEGELVETAMQIGVRESRRISGEYRLELDDLTAGRKFDDGICRVTFNVDIHQPDSDSLHAIRTAPYEIPYRCLVPKTVDQLLVAGRCISGSHEAHGSYRVTGNCVAMGEAAGVGAAQAVSLGVMAREVRGASVRMLMRENGSNI